MSRKDFLHNINKWCFRQVHPDGCGQWSGVIWDGCGKFIWSGGKRMFFWWMVAWRGVVRVVRNSAMEKWRYTDVVCGYNAQ